MLMVYEIRKVSSKDYLQAATIISVALPTNKTPSDWITIWHDKYSKSLLVLGAYNSVGNMIGVLAGGIYNNHFESGWGGVLSPERGKGIGSQLVKVQLLYAIKQGIKEVKSWMTADNGPMIRINLRSGYEITAMGRQLHEPNWLIRMSRDLDKNPVVDNDLVFTPNLEIEIRRIPRLDSAEYLKKLGAERAALEVAATPPSVEYCAESAYIKNELVGVIVAVSIPGTQEAVIRGFAIREGQHPLNISCKLMESVWHRIQSWGHIQLDIALTPEDRITQLAASKRGAQVAMLGEGMSAVGEYGLILIYRWLKNVV